MSEPVMMEQASELANMNDLSGQKRKRASESGSPDSRRHKRESALSVADVESAAFLENTVDMAAQAAQQVAQDHNDEEAKFDALQQASADHRDVHPDLQANVHVDVHANANPDVHSDVQQPGAHTNVHSDMHSNVHRDVHRNAHRDVRGDVRRDVGDSADASSTAAAALNMFPQLHVPPSTEETFAAEARAQDGGSFNNTVAHPDGLPTHNSPLRSPILHTNGVPDHSRYTGSGMSKPAVGSDEWHKMRKDNHKEVERRRRETINEGINELAKIVPGCEKNKGSILQRAVSFITSLKENEDRNLEKWTLEKLLTEQAIAELSASNDKLKEERDRLFREMEMWKRLAQGAGLQPEKESDGSV